MKGARDIIRSARLSEKGTRLASDQNKYFFVVDGKANKSQIRRAVEELFKVTVTKVNTMNYEGKKKRERTSKFGRRPGWKRAVVTVKQGETIELM